MSDRRGCGDVRECRTSLGERSAREGLCTARYFTAYFTVSPLLSIHRTCAIVSRIDPSLLRGSRQHRKTASAPCASR
jgi:hypothetical protein